MTADDQQSEFNTASVDVTINVVEQLTRPPTTGGGGGGRGPPPVPVPSDADFDWSVTRGIDELDRDNDIPTGIWSDGKTLWIVENSASGTDRVFAYDLMTGARLEARDFEPAERNRDPRGIWSDGVVVYVVDEQDDKVYTYNIPDAIDARLASLSLSTVEIDEFSSFLLDYVATADHDAAVTAVELKASQGTANVIIEPADSDGDPENGRQVELNAETTITITVTSEDGSPTMTDQVQVSRPSCLEGLTRTV